MKTMFDNGFRPGHMFFGSTLAPSLGAVQLRGASLGQADIDQALRNQTLAQINSSQQKYDVIHGWIAAYSDQELSTLLGQYKANFWDASSLAEQRQGVADFVYRQFNPDDPQSWNVVTQKDLGYVTEDWLLSIERMYNTIKTVDPSYLQPPVGRKTGVARQAPGAPPKPGNTILGIPKEQALIGGAVAVGAGVILYAILG
jgi:hypothetical protein